MTRKVPKLTGALRSANAKSATKCKVSSPGAAQERRAKFMVSLFSEANEVHAQDNCQQLVFGIAPQAQCNVKKTAPDAGKTTLTQSAHCAITTSGPVKF